MRARSVFPLLFSFCLVLLLASALLWGVNASPPGVAAEGLAWTDLGGPAGGPAQAVAFNPAYPADQTVFAGGGRTSGIDSMEGFGLFRSTDGGATWADRGGSANLALMDVDFSPNWTADGYALAGFWNGVWSTSDHGVSWQKLSDVYESRPPTHVAAVAVGRTVTGTHTLLAGGPYGGVYRSADEGVTWTWNGDLSAINRLRFHPSVSDLALAAADNGLWRSTDGGSHWTRVMTTSRVSDLALASDGSATALSGGLAWRSTDDGQTWQPLTTTPIERLFTLGLSADGAGLFGAADKHLYRYDATAGEFVTVTTQPPLSHILRIAPSPTYGSDQTLLVGTEDGVWRSTDGGQTFVRSAGFVPLPVRSLAAAGGSLTGDLYAGTEYGIWRRSGSTWEPLNAGFPMGYIPIVGRVALSPGYADDQTIFITAGSYVGLGSAVYRSIDRGLTWERLEQSGREYIEQLAISPAFAADHRLYMVANQNVEGSADSGATWVASSFWDWEHRARRVALSPAFDEDHTLVVAGSGIYRSTDAGVTWSAAANPPPLSPSEGTGWQPGQLFWSTSGRLYLSIGAAEEAAPYRYHTQLWVSTDKGQTWSRINNAPDRPLAGLAVGRSTLGGSNETIYLSTYESGANDEYPLAPDLFISRDSGATWLNLGAAPSGGATLLAPVDAADRVWAGSRGVWLLEAGQMPTATPDPVTELLRNRSFEYQDVWRIPETAYPAGYSQEQHFAGYWSMRSGIVDPAANVRSYSDFSQDLNLPISHTITLSLHRWPSNGAAPAAAASAAVALPEAATLEDFYHLVDATGNDLQYVLLIERAGQPTSKITYLYTGLDNQQTWTEQTFDLTHFAGQSVRLQFGTFNNGSGPLAVQYFDALSVQAAAPAAPTPTPTVTPPSGPFKDWLPDIRKGNASIPPTPKP